MLLGSKGFLKVIPFLIGIVLGFGIIFIMFYFDTTIKNAEEIQTKLGLPLLGVVPRVEKEKNKGFSLKSKRGE